MSKQKTWTAVAMAALVGALLWTLAAMLAGRREAWDGGGYWAVAYPLSLLASAGLGYAFAERAWRWPLVLFAGQFVAMCLRNGEVGNLWPLGLALFAVLALPGVLFAALAARFTAAARGTAR